MESGGTPNLNIPYGQMAMALIAQPAIHQSRRDSKNLTINGMLPI
jgi:hypothetical protein